MRVDEKLALDAFKPDEEPHIRLRPEVCRTCRDRVCLRVCPGGLWTVVEGTDEVRVECSGCLECGSCVTCCPQGGIDWAQPRGGCGVRFRCG